MGPGPAPHSLGRSLARPRQPEGSSPPTSHGKSWARAGLSTEKAGEGESSQPDARGGAGRELGMPGSSRTAPAPPEPRAAQPTPVCCPARCSGSLYGLIPWHSGGAGPALGGPRGAGRAGHAPPPAPWPKTFPQLHRRPRPFLLPAPPWASHPTGPPRLCSCHSTVWGPLCPSWVLGTQLGTRQTCP